MLMFLKIGAWNHSHVQEAFALNEKHLHYRRNQLARMVAYAESNDCRRRILLNHFGDCSTIEVEHCCDNCLSRKSAVPQKSQEEFQRTSVIRRLNKETGSFETVSNTSRSGSSTQERIQRVVALGKSRSRDAVPELITALEDSDGNIRRLAASALGKIGDQKGVSPLMQLLEDEEKPQVRQYAVKALGKICDPQAKALLEKIAASGSTGFGKNEVNYAPEGDAYSGAKAKKCGRRICCER